MKYDIVLAGVGGQGVLSIAAIISVAAVESGLYLKQAEVHGMAQRGGAVQSHLRLADRPIFSDLIPAGSADMVLAMEPMEALRYLPALSPEGVVVTEQAPYVNTNTYPAVADLHAALEALPRVALVSAEAAAREMRASRSSNMVLLGAASNFLPLEAAALETAIGTVFGRKGESVVAQNVEAFRRGRALTESAAV